KITTDSVEDFIGHLIALPGPCEYFSNLGIHHTANLPPLPFVVLSNDIGTRDDSLEATLFSAVALIGCRWINSHMSDFSRHFVSPGHLMPVTENPHTHALP